MIKARAPVSGGNFGVWGGMFSTYDCTIKSWRQKEDAWNAILAGFMTGGSLAARSESDMRLTSNQSHLIFVIRWTKRSFRICSSLRHLTGCLRRCRRSVQQILRRRHATPITTMSVNFLRLDLRDLTLLFQYPKHRRDRLQSQCRREQTHLTTTLSLLSLSYFCFSLSHVLFSCSLDASSIIQFQPEPAI
jgi:hypothetical protein